MRGCRCDACRSAHTVNERNRRRHATTKSKERDEAKKRTPSARARSGGRGLLSDNDAFTRGAIAKARGWDK